MCQRKLSNLSLAVSISHRALDKSSEVYDNPVMNYTFTWILMQRLKCCRCIYITPFTDNIQKVLYDQNKIH